jgi:hypothetical protein
MPIETPSRNQRKPRSRFPLLTLLLCLVLGAGAVWWFRSGRKPVSLATLRATLPPVPQLSQLPRLSQLPSGETFMLKPPPLTRPYGMAPQAFAAFMRACNRMKVSPYRIGQTIGNHPRSVGYHQRDGVLKVNGQNIDYCAAVDLGAQGHDSGANPAVSRHYGVGRFCGLVSQRAKMGRWRTHSRHLRRLEDEAATARSGLRLSCANVGALASRAYAGNASFVG